MEINGCKSSSCPVPVGVPQGSILGPLLFIIYVNDIFKTCKPADAILYADDSTCLVSDLNPETAVTISKTIISNLSIWFKANKLSINLKKTNSFYSAKPNKIWII